VTEPIGESMLQAIFEAVADAMVVVDDEGGIVALNAAARRICERPPEPSDDGMEPTSGELRDLFRQVGRGDAEGGDIEVRRRDGGRLVLEYEAGRAFMAGRRLIVLRDVTLQRRLLAEALDPGGTESVRRLAARIAHDLNNTLTPIMGNTELALLEIPDGGAGRPEIEAVAEAVERVRDLVGQIQAFSRTGLLEPAEVDLRTTVAKLTGTLRQLLGSHVRLEIVYGESAAPVMGVRAQLAQVIVNLVTNARDALPEGGEVTVRLGHELISPEDTVARVRPGRYVRLEVADTGTGMDPRTLARLFQPFFTTRAAGGGRGLGLTTAQGIVQRLGGTITVASEPGRGSSFMVLIPAVDPAAATGSGSG
jgi:two-component system cell cycle sensor histidine kinase/response regulator CckA